MNAAPPARLEALLEAVERARDLAELQHIIRQTRDFLAVDHMLYHSVSPAGDQYLCGTYPDIWVQQYLRQDYLRVDPVIQGCYQRFHPVDWKWLDWSGKAARAFQQEAMPYGVGNQGFSVPIHGPTGQFALLSVSHHCDDATWQGLTARHRRSLVLIAHSIHQRALDFEPDRGGAKIQPLSRREVHGLSLLAMGHSRAQVAQTLNISEHTLRVYIESARRKLGAVNTLHAVARATARGLILI